MTSSAGPSRIKPMLATLYAVWGAIGISILVEFGLLLYLQKARRLEIALSADSPAGPVQVGLALVLFAAGALAIRVLRSRGRRAGGLLRETGGRPGAGRAAAAGAGLDGEADASPTGRALLSRFVALSVLAWAVAEALALVGFTLALALAPLPRLAVTIYFTGALALWLWSRPPLVALARAQHHGGSPE